MNKHLRNLSIFLIICFLFTSALSGCQPNNQADSKTGPAKTTSAVTSAKTGSAENSSTRTYTAGPTDTAIAPSDPAPGQTTGTPTPGTTSSGKNTGNNTGPAPTSSKVIMPSEAYVQETLSVTEVPLATSPGKTPQITTPKTSPTPTPTSYVPPSGELTLKYWVNFPTAGPVTTLKAYKFTVTPVDNGVSINAYNIVGTKIPASSVSFIGTWLSSYVITDENGKVLESKDSEAYYMDFKINILTSGGCSTDKKEISFSGYYKDFNGSNAVISAQNLSTSFKITRSSSSWTYSSDYSIYDKSIISAVNNGSYLTCNVSINKGNTLYSDSFSRSNFVYTPNDTVNNGIPTVLINVGSDSEYYDLKTSSDHSTKYNYINASFSIVEGSSKTYNTIGQSGSLQIKRRGMTSFDLDKKPYTLVLSSKMKLLGMAADTEWALIASYPDKTLLRNYLTYNIGRSLNLGYSPDCRNVDLYLGKGDGTSTYLGTYLLVERIGVDKNKINITEMTSSDTNIGWIYGSEGLSTINAGSFLVEMNGPERLGPTDVFLRTSVMNVQVKSPGKSVFNPVSYNPDDRNTWPQITNATTNLNLIDYIRSYLQNVDSCIQNCANSDYLYNYIDLNSFVDHYILQELSKNVDGQRLSTFFYKDKGGKMKVACWDFDLSFGNCNYGTDSLKGDCGQYTGFYIKMQKWYNKLFANATFRNAVKTRWAELRQTGGLLSDTNLTNLINNEANKISKSAEENFKIWPIMGTYVWPNPSAIVAITTYSGQVDYLINWVKNRAAWLDVNIPKITG